MSDTSWATTDAIRRTMVGNRRRDSQPELALRRALHARGLRFRVDVAPLSGVNRRADVVFTKARIAVFLHGCFWHGCPMHYKRPSANAAYWASKVEANRNRDEDTRSRLHAEGWIVVEVWEHDDPAEAADAIERLWRKVSDRTLSEGSDK